MTERQTWFERFSAEHAHDPDFLAEQFVLRMNRELRRFMREHGLTQTELARRMGVSQAYISRLLHYNQNLTLRSLALLADAMGAEWTLPRLQVKGAQPNAADEPAPCEEKPRAKRTA